MKSSNITNWLLFGIFISSLTTTIVWVVIGFGVNRTLQVVPRTLTSISSPQNLKMVHGISQNVRDSLVTVMDDLNHKGALHHMNKDFGNHLNAIHNLVHLTVPLTRHFPTQQFFNESQQWRNTTNHLIVFISKHPELLTQVKHLLTILDKDIPFKKMVQESHEWHGLLDSVLQKLKS